MEQIKIADSNEVNIPRLNGFMKFEYQFDINSPKISIELSSESDLVEVVESFERFLVAAGYTFDGQLDFVSEE